MTVTAPESAAYQRADGIWVIPREEFARDRFDYKPGNHIVFGGPSQRAGKTTMAFKLLEFTATPEFPAYVAVCKPADKVTSSEGKRLGFVRTADYPPPKRIRDAFPENRPPGYLIWPDMTDPETAMGNASAVTERLINGVYADGAKGKKGILVLDDTVTKSQVLGLDRPMVLISTMSGAMGIGGWFFVQKPSDAGKAARWAYPNAEHVFISKDPVKTNREYYDGLSGFDRGIVENATLTLKPFQFLYLERTHNYMCVVDSKLWTAISGAPSARHGFHLPTCGNTMTERDHWPDPVRRVKDEMDMHADVMQSGGDRGYAVFSMQDGRPITHDLYPSRGRARQSAEKLTTDLLLIIEASPDGMPYREADAVLKYERQLNNMGVQSPDVLETEENSGLLSMPRNRHDRRRMARQLVKGRPLYHESVSYGNLPNLSELMRGSN